MKAIIPVAGFGTRLRPHTLTTPKVLLNVAGHPMIYFIIDQLIKEKLVSSIVFITGFLGDKIEDYIRKTFKYDFRFIVQDEPLGLGHAIYCAKPAFVEKKDEEALIILGDTLFDVDLKKMCGSKSSVIGVKEVEDPRRFGVVEKDKKGFITKFVEKPASPDVSPSKEAIVGLYYLKNAKVLFNSLEYTITNNIKTKGEFQLTDALDKMLKEKEKMTTYKVQGWLDCGKPETLLDTNRYILAKNQKKYKFNGSIIVEPCFIGKNVTIEKSIIGPYATINDNCVIRNSIIEDSIINSHCKIENSILSESIVGENAKITGKKFKFNLGEFGETEFKTLS